MKKILFSIAVSMCLLSCTQKTQYKTTNDVPFDYVTKFKYEGHSYISFIRDYGQGGVGGVVHDPNCKHE